jgi:hypothetical protein
MGDEKYLLRVYISNVHEVEVLKKVRVGVQVGG